MENQRLKLIVDRCRGKRLLMLTTSTRWSGDDELPKSSLLAKEIQNQLPDSQIIDCTKLKIWECEGNVSTAKGNKCGVRDSAIGENNPTGNIRCWASFNHKDDELWRVANAIFEADVIIFFASVRWGQTNAVYQRLIERLTWLENRWTTLGETNLLEGKEAGICLVGHNWRGQEVLECQKKVLSYFGFAIPEWLSFNWQWTEDSTDESKSGYKQDRKDFLSDFQIGPKWLNEDFERWFNQHR